MAWVKTVVLLAICSAVGMAVAVSSSVDTLLRTPMFDVGFLWVNATQKLAVKLQNTIFTVPDFDAASTYLGIGVGCVALYYLYQLLFAPMDRVRYLGDLGYVPEGKGLTQKDMANIVRKRRKVGDIPPPYPNGWFSVLESRDLKKGEVKPVSILGKFLDT